MCDAYENVCTYSSLLVGDLGGRILVLAEEGVEGLEEILEFDKNLEEGVEGLEDEEGGLEEGVVGPEEGREGVEVDLVVLILDSALCISMCDYINKNKN